MLIGAGVTTLVLKKHYQKIADEEIASVKTTYKEHYDRLAGNGTITDVDEPEKDIPEGEDIVLAEAGVPPVVAPKEPIAYNKIRTSEERRAEAEKLAAGFGYSTQTREEPEVTTIAFGPHNGSSPAEDEELDAIIEDELIDPSVPYLISVDDFMEGGEGFEQVNLTYFAKDRQLTDDADVLVEDVRQTVGFGNLEKFGVMSGSEDTVYVRNVARKIDYEIIRDLGSYREVVLGDDTWDDAQKEPKVRKFRDGD
jgi:hypothetical protein